MEWRQLLDIDMDGDSLINGIDVDMDADGMPDWWDQDEGSDGRLDVNNPQFGGSTDDGECDHISLVNFLMPTGSPLTENSLWFPLTWLFTWPLLSASQTGQIIFTLPYSLGPTLNMIAHTMEQTHQKIVQHRAVNSNCFPFRFRQYSRPCGRCNLRSNEK